MTLKQSGRASYRWLALTLLMAAGVFAWYANVQYRRLNDLNQRQLSNAAAELKTAVLTAAETVTRFNDKRAEWEKIRDEAKKNRKRLQTEGSEPKLCDFDENQPYLDVCSDNRSPVSQDTRWADLTLVQPVTTPILGIDVTNRDGQVFVSFRFRADKVLQELAFPDSFGLIFIATDKGEILYQDAPSRRRWLRHLRWGERVLRADRPPALQLQNLRQVLGGSEDTWNQLRAVSSQTSVQLGGTTHQLYLQPVVLEHNQRTLLVVGGAVPRNTIINDALMLDTSLVGGLAFLLLLAILGFPFVKLVSLSPCERFRLRDVHLLYVSTGALLVLMTCGSLALDGSIRWRTVADAGLETLAKDLEARFLKEVRNIRDQVADYDSRVGTMSVPTCDDWTVRTSWFSQNPETEGQHLPAGIPSSTWLPWPKPHVHVRQVVWIKPNGLQAWKVTADEIPGKSRINRQRPYFRAVQDDLLFLFRETDGGPAFFIGPDRSNADGKFYTYLSMRSNNSPVSCTPERDGLVVSATAQLLSLDQQPLPAGYGFALVNREGRVLYHSDGRLSLREDFFEELSEGNRLRSMVYAGWHGMIESRYRERPHRLYLHPIGLRRIDERNPASFAIVAFRDTSAERALVVRAFVTGLVVPIAILVAVYAAAIWGLVCLSRFAGHHWSAWLWPHSGLNHIYKRQTMAFVALLLVSAGVYVLSGSVVGFLLIPLVAAVLGIGIYAYGARRIEARRSLSSFGWQTSSVLLILVCLVIAPSMALFRLTLSDEFARLILTERQWIDSQKADLKQAPDVETLTDYYAPVRIRDLKQARERYFGCVPAPFDAAGPDVPATRAPQTSDVQLAVHLNSQAPSAPQVENDGSFADCGTGSSGPGHSSGSAMLQSIGSGGRALAVLHASDGVLTLNNEILARQEFQPGEAAYSPDGTVIKQLRISASGLLGLGLIFGILVWWIRWNTNHLFLADYEANASAAPASKPVEEAWSDCSIDEQMVLLQVERERIANPHQQETIKGLLGKGLLQIDPDLRPCSDEMRAFLRQKEEELGEQIHEWEQVKGGHSWRYVRLILVASIAVLTIFLFATQPSLPSSLTGIATAITGAVTAALKLREATASLFLGSKTTG